MASDGKREGPPAGGGISRRDFLRGSAVAGALGSAGLLGGQWLEAAPASPRTEGGMEIWGPGPVPVRLRINNKSYDLTLEPRTTLLDALREKLEMTGAKRVCDRGTCGACTVILGGKAVYACSVLAVDAQRVPIQTIEGLGRPERLHPLQAAFAENDARQCGFCIPGFVMAAKALLDGNPNPALPEVHRGLSGNFCRCGTYPGMRKAVLAAAPLLAGMTLEDDEVRGEEDGEEAGDEGDRPCRSQSQAGEEKEEEAEEGSPWLSAPCRPPRTAARPPVWMDPPRPAAAPSTPMTSSPRACSGPRCCAALMPTPASSRSTSPPPKACRVSRPCGSFRGPAPRSNGPATMWSSVAASSEAAAEDAVAAIKIEYEVLPHWVVDDKLDGAPEVKDEPGGAEGDPVAALAAAAVQIKGLYGIPLVAYNCLEPHGQICEWTGGDTLTVRCPTQPVAGLASQLAEGLGIPAANVRVVTEYMGGDFGNTFSADRWVIDCARLAQKAGAPVKLMLERDVELTVAGDRPSAYAEIEAGAERDGTLTGWISKSWGSGGLGGSGDPPLPYVFQIPNRRQRHSSILTNTASSRALRAPNHPQACYLTLCALDDLAAALGMNPLDFFLQNLKLTGQVEHIYREELAIADQLMGWRQRWHPRGDAARGPVKRGLGLSLHTWGNCEVLVNNEVGGVQMADVSVDVETGVVKVNKIVAVQDCGLIVDLKTAESQVYGGLDHGHLRRPLRGEGGRSRDRDAPSTSTSSPTRWPASPTWASWWCT